MKFVSIPAINFFATCHFKHEEKIFFVTNIGIKMFISQELKKRIHYATRNKIVIEFLKGYQVTQTAKVAKRKNILRIQFMFG